SGKVNIDAAQVERLESEDQDIARRWEAVRETMPTLSGTEVEEEVSPSVAEESEEAEALWSGSLELGFAAVEAASSRQEYLVDMENSWAVEADRLDLNLDIRRERAEGDTLVDKQHFGTAYNRYLSERFFIAPG